MLQPSPLAVAASFHARRWTVRAARFVAWIALAGAARAHEVFPLSLSLRPGGFDFVSVVDPGGCPATIQAKSSNPNKLKVYAVDMLTGAICPATAPCPW